MKGTNAHKKLAAIILVILLIPGIGLLAEIVGSYMNARLTYTTAVSVFESGDHAKAQAVFNQINGYADSGLYVQYVQGEVYLEQAELGSAAIIFQALSGVEFLDAKQLFDYTQGLRAELMDKPRQAMILFNRAGIRDADARYAALAAQHPDIDITKDELPANAKVNGFAFVMANAVAAVPAPGVVPTPTPEPTAAPNRSKATPEPTTAPFESGEIVRTLAFDWDAKGMIWAQIALPDKEETLGYIALSSLYLMTPADEASYAAALKAAPPPATDHYARLTTNDVNVRPEPK